MTATEAAYLRTARRRARAERQALTERRQRAWDVAHKGVLADRIEYELALLGEVVQKCEQAVTRATQYPADQEFYIAAAALHLHNFYSGLERLFKMIATEMEQRVPSDRAWRRELLTQMAFPVTEVRPAVLDRETARLLDEYLRFRHVVHRVYALHLDAERVGVLVTRLRPIYERARKDLERFARFLRRLARADEETPGGREMTTCTEEFAPYIAGLVARERARRRRMRRRAAQAVEAARAAARLLRRRFGATRVRLFGSALYPERFYEHSDVDLAVEGLDPKDYLRAWVAVNEPDICGDFEFDLVTPDMCRPAIWESVEREGVDL